MFGTQMSGTETDPQSLEKQLSLYQQHLVELPASATEIDRARIQLADVQHVVHHGVQVAGAVVDHIE